MSGWNIDNNDLLALLEAHQELNRMIASSTTTFEKGAYIYMSEDQPANVYFILKGKVRLGAFMGEDKDVIHDILTEGDMFNESALTNGTVKNEYALAMDDVTLAVVSKDLMTDIYVKFPEFNMFMMKAISEKIDEKQSRLESLVFKNSRTRIIEFLINQVHKKGQRVGYEWVLRNFYTHQDIANLTSTSRQSVTTILNELREKNIIQFDRKRMLVRDLSLLIAQINM